METFVNFTCQHAHVAHWVFFVCLMLAGLNVPLSEDAILIVGGAIASTCIPDHALRLFLWILLGCWLSGMEAYWIGRLLGPKLYDIHWFNRIITPPRIERLHHYYEKFGVFTFIVGRFIPGGVRNALFMSSGLGKMPFHRFILRDGIACCISTSTIFYIGYTVGENYQQILHYIKTYNAVFLALILTALTVVVSLFFWNKKNKKTLL